MHIRVMNYSNYAFLNDLLNAIPREVGEDLRKKALLENRHLGAVVKEIITSASVSESKKENAAEDVAYTF